MSKLQVDANGTVVLEDRIVGEFADNVLTIDAGWARLAGLGVRVTGDYTDRRRVLFERVPQVVSSLDTTIKTGDAFTTQTDEPNDD